MKMLFSLVLMTGMITTCQTQNQKKAVSTVKYVDLTYYGDWTGAFSFKADSAGAYSFMSRKDSFYTGILTGPLRDSIFGLLTLIQKDTMCTVNQDPCDDCSAVHLIIREAKDSFSVVQSPAKCDKILTLLGQIETTMTKPGAGRKDTIITFQSTVEILPVPPMPAEPKPVRKLKNKK